MNYITYYKDYVSNQIIANKKQVIEEANALTVAEIIANNTLEATLKWKIKSFIEMNELTNEYYSIILNKLQQGDEITVAQFMKKPGKQNVAEKTQIGFAKLNNVNLIKRPANKNLYNGTLKSKTIDGDLNGINVFMKVIGDNPGGAQTNVLKEAIVLADLAKNYYQDEEFILLIDYVPTPGKDYNDINKRFFEFKKLEGQNVKVMNSDQLVEQYKNG